MANDASELQGVRTRVLERKMDESSQHQDVRINALITRATAIGCAKAVVGRAMHSLGQLSTGACSLIGIHMHLLYGRVDCWGARPCCTGRYPSCRVGKWPLWPLHAYSRSQWRRG